MLLTEPKTRLIVFECSVESCFPPKKYQNAFPKITISQGYFSPPHLKGTGAFIPIYILAVSENLTISLTRLYLIQS